MKKILSLILCVFFACGGLNVCAADEYAAVEIQIQLGSYVAYVGDETRPCEAPFLQGGLTMAPVDILSLGFGKESQNKIEYNNIEIEFTSASRTATVDGKDVQMPAAAVTVNGSLMVPVRFVCDTLGALIEYEDATGKITITKSADYSDIFGKPVNGYWCNEDYGWMINLSTDYDVKRQEYDGSATHFINSEASAKFTVFAEKTDYTSIEQIKMKVLTESLADVVRYQEFVTLKCGTKAYYIEFEESSSLFAIKNGLLYEVNFLGATVSKYESLKNEAKLYMLTFCFEIDKSKNPENVSELNEGGYIIVADKLLGFTVNRIKSWTDLKNVSRNITSWSYVNYDLITDFKDDEFFNGEMKVSVFTREADDTLTSLIEREEKYVKNRYNPKYLKNVSICETTSKEDKGAQINFQLVLPGKVQINKTKYFIIEDYVYKAEYYVVYSSFSDESKLKLDEIERMFDSIKITGAKSSQIGPILNTAKHIDTSVTKVYKNQYEDISMTIPAVWNVRVSSDSIEGVEPEGRMEVYCQMAEGISSLEKAKSYFESILGKTEKTTFCGKIAYKSVFAQRLENGDSMEITMYIFVHNNKAYCVASGIKDVYRSAENVKTVENIMKSIKLL